jgi:hypothetical protein
MAHFLSVNRKIKYTIPTPHNFAKFDFTIKWNIVSLPIDVMTLKINVNKIIWIGGMFSYRVQWLIKCWINDIVNKTFNCLGTDILKLYTSYRGDRFQVPTRLMWWL